MGGRAGLGGGQANVAFFCCSGEYHLSVEWAGYPGSISYSIWLYRYGVPGWRKWIERADPRQGGPVAALSVGQPPGVSAECAYRFAKPLVYQTRAQLPGQKIQQPQ